MLIGIFVTLALMIAGAACPTGAHNMNDQQSAAQTKSRNAPVGVGEVAPDFTLEDQDGNKVSLSGARGKSPVVLVFYRGYW